MQQDPPPPSGEPGQGGGWLPPQPTGPAPPTGPAGPQSPGQSSQAPQYEQQPGEPPQYTPPQYTPPQAQPPPQPPPGWQQPPPQGYPPQAWAPQPQEPGNGEAVGGFVCGVASLAMLLVTLGLSTIISLACSVIAVFLGRRGKQKIQRGDTRKHGGLAQAAFITGIVAIPLSVIATALWILVILSDDFQEGFEEGLEDSNSSMVVPALRVTTAIGRAIAG